MKFRSVLLAVSCWLSAVSGQWVEKTIGLPDSLTGLHDPGPMLYNPGNNVLFIAGSNGLALVDGLSNRVIARTTLDGLHSGTACYASQVNKVYWPGYYYDNVVYSLDGASGRVLARIAVYSPYDVCYNPAVNKVYVLGGSSSAALTVINAADDVIVRTLNLGSQWSTSLCCNPGDNKVYSLTYDAATLTIVDCSVDSIKQHVLVGGTPYALLYNRVSNKLYCYGYDSTLTIIDGHGDSIRGRIVRSGPTARAAYNPVANKLYCADGDGVDIICGYGDTLLARLEPARIAAFVFDSTDNLMWCRLSYTDTLVAIDGRGDTLCGAVAVGGSPEALSYNPTRNRLYTTQYHLTVIDPAARRIEQRVLLSFTPAALCGVRSSYKVYCAGLNEATVAVISALQNRVMALIPVGRGPVGLAYDRPLGLVCCACQDSTLSLISCNADSVIGTVHIGESPELVCVDTALHKAWCRFYDGVAVVDLRAESLCAVIPVPGRGALLADPNHARVWCATGFDGHVVALDAAGDSIIASIPVGGEASALCLIPGTSLVGCATQYNNAVAVIDGATNRVVNIVPVGESPQALLYNPRRNKLYCANNGSSDVTAIDCSTMMPVATITVGTSPWALAYDSMGDRVYCTNLSVDRVAVIDCRRDTMVTGITVGDYPSGLAYIQPQRRMYVANQYGSSLSVIRDTARAGIEAPDDLPTPPASAVTVVRGVLFLAAASSLKPQAPSRLLDISGRKVLDLHPGANNVRSLAPGVYFVREASGVEREASSIHKVVVMR